MSKLVIRLRVRLELFPFFFLSQNFHFFRMGNEADAGSDNLGFRCAVSLPTGTSEKKPKGKKKNGDKVAKEEPTVTELPEGAKFVRPNPADLNGKGKKKKNRNEL